MITHLRRAKERGITVAVITQRPAVLNAVDKLLILRAGRLEAFGPPSEVLHRLVRTNGRVVPTARARLARSLRHDDRVVRWLATAAVTLLAGFLRLHTLGRPHAFLFDETYYAKDAWSLWHHGYVTNYVSDANAKILAGNLHGLFQSSPSMVVHPELGKWLIGLGEELFGMNPFGWRIASAVVGTLMITVMVRLATGCAEGSDCEGGKTAHPVGHDRPI